MTPPSTELDRFVEDVVSRRNIHHVVVAIESGDGTYRASAASGTASGDGRPMTVDTPYNIASIDKLMVASMILKLQESALLAIDDPLSEHLSSDVIGGLHRLDGTDHTHSITLRHLLSHTSGLRDSLEGNDRGERPFIDVIIAEGDREWTLQESVRRAANMTPHFPPQPHDKPKIRYSSTNFELLMLVIEQVTGGPIESAFHDLLIDPLGLDYTWLQGRTSPKTETFAPASLWAGPDELDFPLAFRSIPTVLSTTADQIAFLKRLHDGSLLNEASLDLFSERWLRFSLPKDKAAVRAPSWPIEYGLGMLRFDPPRFVTPFQSVPAVVGHTGSTGTWLFYAPQLDLYTAGAVNQITAGALPFRQVPKMLARLDYPFSSG